ncbi:sulfatase family protein [Olivibacter domesticus]|uniref:Arylsulfatase A n=1 Tax=Olivibacter domesticus TaxID=407022 RepID=A0A1H7ZHD6_OLID1|nr:sulfatase-like hydrolase/transferase [Olivibacter domesticus]SEM56837.1 Arylsulfatase A [Olivibacter domesticus]
MKLHTGIYVIGLVFLFITARAQGPAKGDKPNVILIYSDDQGWADLGSYGATDLLTPTLDSLALRGTRFTQFYAASPICSPSRASMLTGRYPQRAGLPEMASSKEGVEGMPAEQYTMGELFQDAGYATAHIGKWHVGYTPQTMPNAQGFDYSFGFMGGCIDNYSHFFYWAGPNRHDLWRNGKEIDESGRFFPDLMVEEAGAFLENNKTNPFFLYFAINIPHYPLQGEKKWLDYYREKGVASPRDKYAAFISTMDEKIAMLLAKLKALGLSENTIVIFQPDQGFSEEERTFGGGGSAGIYRGSKFSLLEGGVRVPAIISWPGHIPENEVRDQLAANIDWYPTLAEYCQIPLPERKIDGKSLVKVINGKHEPSAHEAFYWQSGGSKDDPQWAVRQGDWKLLHNPMQVAPQELDKQKYMLINLAEDPSEKRNVSQKYPDKVLALKALHQRWLKEVYHQ